MAREYGSTPCAFGYYQFNNVLYANNPLVGTGTVKRRVLMYKEVVWIERNGKRVLALANGVKTRKNQFQLI